MAQLVVESHKGSKRLWGLPSKPWLTRLSRSTSSFWGSTTCSSLSSSKAWTWACKSGCTCNISAASHLGCHSTWIISQPSEKLILSAFWESDRGAHAGQSQCSFGLLSDLQKAKEVHLSIEVIEVMIGRAELAAIAAALTHDYTRIATDSLSSLHQLRKQI
eukprot:617006-Pelagomonas_calceolata.AAC.1